MCNVSRSPRPKFNSEWIKLHDGSKITLRSLKKEDIPQCLEIRKAVYGSPFTVEEWRWKYGPSSPYFFDVLVGEYQENVIGMQALLAFPFQFGGEIKQSLNLLDLMIHPLWQKKGVFSAMIAKVERELRGSFSFMYTFPNERSCYGFIRKFGWKRLFSPCLLVRPALLYPDAKLDSQRQIENRVGILKDKQYIRWRYSRPGRTY
ncbi:GNAT family N-acetyltransferase, partial [candidate division WOR-3 bacterium]|nr:GNAT family N-acetyltransferase [candidate division WOR-3 bacterium]MBD3364644.1 GNAT family N-acetyltransferase [candidate division WOR-3 bacterium]